MYVNLSLVSLDMYLQYLYIILYSIKPYVIYELESPAAVEALSNKLSKNPANGVSGKHGVQMETESGFVKMNERVWVDASP